LHHLRRRRPRRSRRSRPARLPAPAARPNRPARRDQKDLRPLRPRRPLAKDRTRPAAAPLQKRRLHRLGRRVARRQPLSRRFFPRP